MTATKSDLLSGWGLDTAATLVVTTAVISAVMATDVAGHRCRSRT